MARIKFDQYLYSKIRWNVLWLEFCARPLSNISTYDASEVAHVDKANQPHAAELIQIVEK